MLLSVLRAGASGVSLNPSPTDLPGTNVLQQIADGIGSWALIAAVVGVVVGGAMWAFGQYSQNYQQAYNGRKGVLVSGLAALLVGAAPAIITFFLGQGHAVR
jgi:type IV secretory pathway VirB2 component (pilin)